MMKKIAANPTPGRFRPKTQKSRLTARGENEMGINLIYVISAWDMKRTCDD
ncbi:MAG: hypothetical protein HY461_00230 [Parcubacteria group bacterium]|nr:hypothetical protein [Parcubacteria group bacterium]